MANPRVRPFLHFFPEDTGPGGCVSDAYQAHRWLHGMDPELLTPAVKRDNQDYFIFEPTILADQSVCMPFQWFECSGIMHAHVWCMLLATQDNCAGWLVLKYDCFKVAISDLAASFPYFARSFQLCKVPDPTIIFGKN